MKLGTGHGATWLCRKVAGEPGKFPGRLCGVGVSCAFRIQYTTVLSQGETNLGGKEGGRNWFFLWNGIIHLFNGCSQNAY